MKKFAILLLALLISGSVNAASPSTLKMKLYAFYVSTNSDCSNPTQVYSNSNPEYTDMVNEPTLGNGSVPDGTYPCVIMVISDQIKFISDTATGSCDATTENTIQICRSGTGTSYQTPGTSTLTACTNAEQQVPIYLSTASTANSGGDGSNAFEAPQSASDATRGFRLNGALTVAGSKTGIFFIDFTGQVDGSNASCDVQPPTFGFR